MTSDAPGLEALLGDPFDDENPLGFATLAEADERAEPFADGERLLDAWGWNAEFVPSALGGRWSGTDELARRLRPVFRRDAALGLGYGVTTLMAAVTVWVAGDPAQQRRLARELSAGSRIAVAFHELDHGNDLLHNEFGARVEDGRFVLDGRKEVINNLGRADAVVLFARTGEQPGPRAHSLLLVGREELTGPGVRHLPRYETVAMRGCVLGGVELTGHAVSASSLVGAEGRGLETAMNAFQVTRIVLPALALGVLDSALHLVHRFAARRRLYGLVAGDLPHARATLVAAFVDLLIADSLSTAAARGLHLAPRYSSAPAAAVKYLVPLLLEEAMAGLAVVLGARSYLREGPEAAFGRFLRDLPALSIGHAGAVSCLLTILPQLPALARRAWRPAAAPPELFDLDAALPELDFSRLSVAGTGQDLLAASLLEAADQLSPHDPVGTLVHVLADELRRLTAESAALPAAECLPTASTAAFALAERYSVLMAAAACVGVWRARPAAAGGWIRPALIRLASRLGRHDGVLPESEVETLSAELARRVDRRLSCCLDPVPIFGRP